MNQTNLIYENGNIMNKTSIATILGAAAVGLIKKRIGSSAKLKLSPRILVIPGEDAEWTIEYIPANFMQPINEVLDQKLKNVFEHNSLEIPDKYKPYIDKVTYAYHDELVNVIRNQNEEFYIYEIYASPRVYFKPNVFTDWQTSVDTRRKLNEMFNPSKNNNFIDFLIRSNENLFDGLIRKELGDMINPAEAYYMQFPNEYDDSDEGWEREDWENRYENWGDGAISVYNEKVIINVDTGEIYETPKPTIPKLRNR